jgi:hypothetical protein
MCDAASECVLMIERQLAATGVRWWIGHRARASAAVAGGKSCLLAARVAGRATGGGEMRVVP